MKAQKGERSRHKRRLRIGLRWLFVVVALVALPCSWLAWRLDKASRQERAIQTLRYHGAWLIKYEYQGDTPGPHEKEPPEPKWLRSLLGEHFFRRVTWVQADYGTLRELDCLRALPTVEGLDLTGCPVTDLSPIVSHDNLRFLIVSETQVTDLSPLRALNRLDTIFLSQTKVEDLSPLADLPQLSEIWAGDTRVSDLNSLQKASELEVLSVQGSLVTDISGLAHLVKLRDLNLDDTRVKDLSALSNLPNLEWLSIRNTLVHDLEPLKEVSTLRVLRARNTPIRSVAALRQLKSLRRIELMGRDIEQDEIAELRRHLPNCEIYAD